MPTQTKAQTTFEKVAFIAVTPWKVKDNRELKTGKGWLKEYGNRFTSQLLGAAPGVAVATAGAFTRGKARLPLIAGGAALGFTGAVTSDIRAIRKTERGAGVQPTGTGKYLGRHFGSVGAGMLIPAVGSPLGDYYVSRKLQTYKKAKNK